MEKKNDDNLQSRRLHQLMAEVEGPAKSKRKPDSADTQTSRSLASFLRWSIFGLFCLGSGFWAGSFNAELRLSLGQPSEAQSLSSQGWRKDGTGIFYRWCLDNCHVPRLFGGGVLQVFEVKCVDRPCGDIHMEFNVLSAEGKVVDQISLREKGMQGETRRFYIESQQPDASSLELSQFSARAKV